jgi:hypothetical protein
MLQGTFGISFSDNEEWGSNIYHTNAREQIGKSVMECVILAQRRAELPPCHRSVPGRTDARPSVATQAKKRKGQSKPVSNTFGFDTMSISDHFEDTVVGKSKPPSSNYKLYNKDVDATDLWQEGSIVFIPAKELLSQFFYTIDQPRVERAIKDMIEGSGNNVQPKVSVENIFVGLIYKLYKNVFAVVVAYCCLLLLIVACCCLLLLIVAYCCCCCCYYYYYYFSSYTMLYLVVCTRKVPALYPAAILRLKSFTELPDRLRFPFLCWVKRSSEDSNSWR